jgi:peptidoglycan/LPS O-acetylase OafA/YrhL
MPLLKIGQYSYEVYLTHMFIVFGLFDLFLDLGKPMRLVPILFTSTLLAAGVLGGVVAHLYSEPMNRYLRQRWGTVQNQRALVVDTHAVVPSEGSPV